MNRKALLGAVISVFLIGALAPISASFAEKRHFGIQIYPGYGFSIQGGHFGGGYPPPYYGYAPPPPYYGYYRPPHHGYYGHRRPPQHRPPHHGGHNRPQHGGHNRPQHGGHWRGDRYK